VNLDLTAVTKTQVILQSSKPEAVQTIMVVLYFHVHFGELSERIVQNMLTNIELNSLLILIQIALMLIVLDSN